MGNCCGKGSKPHDQDREPYAPAPKKGEVTSKKEKVGKTGAAKKTSAGTVAKNDSAKREAEVTSGGEGKPDVGVSVKEEGSFVVVEVRNSVHDVMKYVF